MNTFLIFLLNFLVFGYSISEINVSEEKVFDSLDLNSSEVRNNPKDSEMNGCPQKCSEEIEILKKNISELYSAFMSLQSQLEHMNRHLTFHEKALKHIAVWGHKPSGHHNHNDNTMNEEQTEQTDNSNLTLRAHTGHKHNHQHSHHHKHSHHNHHQTSCNCGHGIQKVEDNDNNKRKDNQNKDNSEESKESSEENKSTEEKSKTTLLPNFELKDNESIPLNDSQTKNLSEKSPKRIGFSKPMAVEQMYFQSMKHEFKEWFSDMLKDVHNTPDGLNLHNDLKGGPRLDQSAIDEMENTLSSEDLIFAVCNVKPNRHIALLNQQNVEGTINLWQLKHNRGPLHMDIQLKGFKVNNHNHEHSYSQTYGKHNGHQNSKVRRIRESILIPVEVEPEGTTQPIGASHSHGFHVHEFGNMSRDCQSVGNHYNPLNLSHGGPYDVIRHIGDLGNIRCDRNGEINTQYIYSQISLSGIHSIINRSLVIHSNIDDYGRNPKSSTSSQSGTSGVRIACCVIEEVKQLPKIPQRNIQRRDTSGHTFVNRRRFEDINFSEIMKKQTKFENDRKYKNFGFN